MSEIEARRDQYAATVIALGVALAHARQLLYLAEGCVANPSRENRLILQQEEERQRDFINKLSKSLMEEQSHEKTAEGQAAAE